MWLARQLLPHRCQSGGTDHCLRWQRRTVDTLIRVIYITSGLDSQTPADSYELSRTSTVNHGQFA